MSRDARTPPPVVTHPGVAAERHASRDGDFAAGEACDYCGAEALAWRKCKLICSNCSQINKSCADL